MTDYELGLRWFNFLSQVASDENEFQVKQEIRHDSFEN